MGPSNSFPGGDFLKFWAALRSYSNRFYIKILKKCGQNVTLGKNGSLWAIRHKACLDQTQPLSQQKLECVPPSNRSLIVLISHAEFLFLSCERLVWLSVRGKSPSFAYYAISLFIPDPSPHILQTEYISQLTDKKQ